MVTNDTVLGRIAERWREGGLFRVRWANLVGGWCIKYFRRYGKAPKGNIESLFESWADRANDEDTVDLVDRFLAGISDDYEAEAEEINPDYLVDIAGAHFNAVSLEHMAETVKGHIAQGDVNKALVAAAEWDKVEMGVGAGVDVLHDKTAVQEAFESVGDPLIKYPGALGNFMGDQLGRDEFVGIIGATGRGKTWWLMDVGWMGIRQHRRVAFFEIGDMSQNQIMRRFMCRNTAHPIKPPYEFEVPVSITREDGAALSEVETETRSFEGPLHWQMAWEACVKKTRRHKKPLLRLSVHPSDSISIDGIVEVLNVWERDGWVPDVVVVDYADVLAAPPGYTPGDREAINATWKKMRGLSQTRHILVVTGTQADAPSYEAHTLRRRNFTDDRRKLDHVTAMFGINATEEEQEAGIFRLNWTKRREEVYTESRCVHVAGCLHIGRPHIKSTF
jgi:hypothetical protein